MFAGEPCGRPSPAEMGKQCSVLVLLLSLVAGSLAQAPILHLFHDEPLQASFHVPVDSGTVSLLLATNPNKSALVTGPVDRIEVQLAGAMAGEGIEVTHESVLIQLSPQYYVFTFPSTLASLENFNSLLATLRYVSSNLTVDSLSQTSRNVTIVAFNNTTASDPAVANIQLQRANTGAPDFNQVSYSIAIREDASNDDLVTSDISATDPEGLAVVYSFADSEFSNAFSINPTSAEVRVANTTLLDFETTSSVSVTVLASDSDPIARLTSSAQLVVELTNVNDNPPRFSAPTYTYEVPEESLQALVGFVAATDADELGGLEYGFVDAEISGDFAINRGTGVISVRSTLDYERVPSYTFTVQVSDGSFFDTAVVTVNVVDVADNRPVLTPFSSNIYLDLDRGERDAVLSAGDGGTHRVEDDSTALGNGSARVYVVRNRAVRRFSYYFLLDYSLRRGIAN